MLALGKEFTSSITKKVSTCERLSKYSFYNWRTVFMHVMPVILTECQGPPGLKTINWDSLRGRASVITLRTVTPCISWRRGRARSAVGHLFCYSGSAFSTFRTYCSRNPRWSPSQETPWWPALGAEAQISNASSTGHSLLMGVKCAEGRNGWGLVWALATFWMATTPLACCKAKPVVYIEVFNSNEKGMIACNLAETWWALLSLSSENSIFSYSNTN